MWSNGVDEVHDTRCQDGTLLAEDMLVPFPESGGVASFSVSADVIGGMTGVRLLVAECGDASNPGIAEIYVTAS
jgi:N-acetylglutamate synthase-like GNAT family acetyltransferase